MMKRFCLLLFVVVFGAMYATAQNFEKVFADSTLRIDYIFAGSESPVIALHDIMRVPGWAGRRGNLDTVPFEGNGDLTLKDARTGEVLYCTSFSSLYQEWLNTPAATPEVCPSFEFTLLVPEPRAEVCAEVVLRGKGGCEIARFSHKIATGSDCTVRNLASHVPVPFEYVHRGGSPKECIDVALVAEGYTPAEMSLFMEDARVTAQEILSYAPFAQHSDKFNFVAVMAPSADSGVSIPQDGVWCETAVNASFMTFGIPRYLTAKSLFRLHNLLVNIPYEHIIVLANTDEYGGGGIFNSYALTTAHHKNFKPVVVHEFGHSFAGLADEYASDFDETYLLDVEPWEPNITTLVDFASKWEGVMSAGVERPSMPTDERREGYVIGLYEGAGYRNKGIYRPTVTCRMRDNVAHRFCPVCEKALERVILHQTQR